MQPLGVELADVQRVRDGAALGEIPVGEPGEESMGILELKEDARPLTESGGQVQADPFKQEPVVASRFVPLEAEPVVGLVSHPRLSAEVENQGSDPHILQARPELVLAVDLSRGTPLLGAGEHRREEDRRGGQPGSGPGKGPPAKPPEGWPVHPASRELRINEARSRPRRTT